MPARDNPAGTRPRALAVGLWAWNRMNGPSGRTLLTSLLGQIFTLITGVVAARALGVDGRGDLAILWITPLAVVMIGGVGLPQATAYFTAREQTGSRRVAVVMTSLRAAVPILAVLSCGYLAAAVLLTSPDSDLRIAALVSASLVPLILLQMIGVMTLQGLQKFNLFNLTRVLPVALYAGGAFILFVSGRASLTSLVAASAVGFAISLVSTWIQVWGCLRAESRGKSFPVKELISFGARGILGSVNPVEDARTDQLMVGYLIGARGLGLYASAASFTNVPRFIAEALGAVAFPRVAAGKDRLIQWSIVERALVITSSAVIAAVGLVEIALPFLIELLFGRDFLGAVPIGRVLLVAAGLLAMKRLMTDLVRGLGSPGYGSVAEIINLGVFAVGIGLMAFLGDLSALGISYGVLGGGIASSGFLILALVRIRLRVGASDEER